MSTADDDITIQPAPPPPQLLNTAPCCSEDPFSRGEVLNPGEIDPLIRTALANTELASDSITIWPAVRIRDDAYLVLVRDDEPFGLAILEEAGLREIVTEPVWAEVSVGPPPNSVRETRIVWTGLPVETALVRIDYPEGPTTLQRPIARAAFFGIAKPQWNQNASLAALDAAGRTITSTELRLDGGGCSAHTLRSAADFQNGLPDDIATVRDSLVKDTVTCDINDIVSIIQANRAGSLTHDGENRLDDLRDLDLAYPILRGLWQALDEPFSEVSDNGIQVYEWTSPDGLVSVDISSLGVRIESRSP